jgi:hypothetical protein
LPLRLSILLKSSSYGLACKDAVSDGCGLTGGQDVVDSEDVCSG